MSSLDAIVSEDGSITVITVDDDSSAVNTQVNTSLNSIDAQVQLSTQIDASVLSSGEIQASLAPQAKEIVAVATAGPRGAPGLIQSIVAGTNVSVDNTDPANPIVSSTGGSGSVSDWGDIGGNIEDQTDLWNILQTKLESVSWGQILGTLSDQTDLQNALNLKLESVDIADINATGTPDNTTYLRGDGTWSTPAGGGGGLDIGDSIGNSPTANGIGYVDSSGNFQNNLVQQRQLDYFGGAVTSQQMNSSENSTIRFGFVNLSGIGRASGTAFATDASTPMQTFWLDTDNLVSYGVITIDPATPTNSFLGFGFGAGGIGAVRTFALQSGSAAFGVPLTVGGNLTVNNSGQFQINGTQAVGSILDQDDMASNSNTALATQQSIKAYVDANAGGSPDWGDIGGTLSNQTDLWGVLGTKGVIGSYSFGSDTINFYDGTSRIDIDSYSASSGSVLRVRTAGSKDFGGGSVTLQVEDFIYYDGVAGYWKPLYNRQGISPAGSDGQLQYKNGSALAAAPLSYSTGTTEFTQTAKHNLTVTSNAQIAAMNAEVTSTWASGSRQDGSSFKITASNNASGQFVGLYGQSRVASSNTAGTLVGFRGDAQVESTASATNARGGVMRAGNSSSGTLTNATGMYIESAYNSGGGTLTNNYGIRVEDQTAGTNNWAIFTGRGRVKFGRFEPSRPYGFTWNGSDEIVASSGQGYGAYFNATVGASANSDELNGFYFTGTFNANGYTGLDQKLIFIQNTYPNVIALKLRAAPSQAADILKIVNNSNADVFTIQKDGRYRQTLNAGHATQQQGTAMYTQVRSGYTGSGQSSARYLNLIARDSATSSYWGEQMYVQTDGAGDISTDDMGGYDVLVQFFPTTGDAGDMFGFRSQVYANGDSAGNGYAFYAKSAGGSKLNDVFGIYIESQTVGLNSNYSIYTNAGDVRLMASNSDKIGFHGVTPVARQLLATGAGATVDDVITALQNLGLVRQS